MTCSSPRPSALTGKLFLLFAGLFVARQLLLVRKVGLRLGPAQGRSPTSPHQRSITLAVT